MQIGLIPSHSRIYGAFIKPLQPSHTREDRTNNFRLPVPFLFMLFIHLSSSSISISITEGVSSSKMGLEGEQKQTEVWWAKFHFGEAQKVDWGKGELDLLCDPPWQIVALPCSPNSKREKGSIYNQLSSITDPMMEGAECSSWAAREPRRL